MSWGVFEYADTVQVVPLDDIKEHDLNNCHCLPYLKNGVYVHNSFNGREHGEIKFKS